jgi:hypothetical protein
VGNNKTSGQKKKGTSWKLRYNAIRCRKEIKERKGKKRLLLSTMQEKKREPKKKVRIKNTHQKWYALHKYSTASRPERTSSVVCQAKMVESQ